jgi:Ser/Thr protein kinase RdoA (MazF antagonist)
MCWLPGADLDEPDAASMRALGRATATLHAHAARWQLPAGARFATLDTVLMGITNHLQPTRRGAGHSGLTAELMTPERQAVIDTAIEHVQTRYDSLWSRASPIVLHADLHRGNVKWLRGRLAVFDFDDAACGVPALDLGITAYYLRDELELEQAVLEGYAEISPLPDFTRDEFEAIVAGRNLLLLNDVVVADQAELRDVLPRYVPNSVTKLRAYLDTGVYRHQVPGLIPAA